MAVIKAFAGALGGTFADLWRDIITAGPFTEHTVVVPGIPRGSNNDRGSNEYDTVVAGTKLRTNRTGSATFSDMDPRARISKSTP